MKVPKIQMEAFAAVRSSEYENGALWIDTQTIATTRDRAADLARNMDVMLGDTSHPLVKITAIQIVTVPGRDDPSQGQLGI